MRAGSAKDAPRLTTRCCASGSPLQDPSSFPLDVLLVIRNLERLAGALVSPPWFEPKLLNQYASLPVSEEIPALVPSRLNIDSADGWLSGKAGGLDLGASTDSEKLPLLGKESIY